jgi:hypothetical protein
MEPQNAVDLEAERAALLQIHALDRQAHFATNADGLLAHSAEQFISVSGGAISRATRDDLQQMFTAYFKDATYYEWDDLEPPIVRIARDASMAWMIVRTKVRRTQPDASGAKHERQFIYAGIMTYEKRDGRWLRVANVSTFA